MGHNNCPKQSRKIHIICEQIVVAERTNTGIPLRQPPAGSLNYWSLACPTQQQPAEHDSEWKMIPWDTKTYNTAHNGGLLHAIIHG